MDMSAPVVIARAWADSEASVIKSLLESYNIPCHYSSALPTRLYPLSAGGVGQIRVFVPASLAQEARRILEEHRRHRASLRLVGD
jgi:flagellar biosynthesis protein FlhB